MKNPITLTAITLLLAASSLPAATHYVSLGSTHPTPPYTNWLTAATNIQDAVDAAQAGDRVVVTDGVYAVGQRETLDNWGRSLGFSRVAVTNTIGLLSVNGPQFTLIDGGGVCRCCSLNDGASLTGFTLTNGYVAADGGGVRCTSLNAFLTNCAIVGNWAWYGGGAYGGTLYNCTLSGNSIDTSWSNDNSGGGGGASWCTLYSCTLNGNDGSGANACWLYNCIVYFNSGANYDSSSSLNYCCTTPLPTSGVGNIARDPQLASSSHLSAGSSCRGAGSAAGATGTDIDGEPWGNPPSIGCDEYHAGAVTGPFKGELGGDLHQRGGRLFGGLHGNG
jgi:hypothetical protein